ncbi:metal-dependent hydrolase [Sulfuricurvum sp.]|uniref:metal-dependent hydrolase n=1 Tax=Sulfuricurvum sp. TaxID=2025608 RepID=UPI00261F8317|nr:metal-dependent hydrolase [Sulfuricurvum sp.]MDD2782391.1 metal-dependent hydrolase [Sulfuricurvum sp.]
MTWKSHTAIAIAIALPFSPASLPAVIIGATAPDWLEYVAKFFGVHVKHRQETHYLIIPIMLIALSFLIDFRAILFWFGIGYLSHWFADSLTITGVPITPNDKHKIHLLGGKIKTGEPLEYIVAFGLLIASVSISSNAIELLNQEHGFNKYHMDYGYLQKNGIIDNKEALETRFKLF